MRPEDDLPLDDADQALIKQLRALPPEGDEPNWDVLEKSIREAVGPSVPRAPWWKRWQILVPIGVVTAATAAMLLWLSRPAPTQAPIAMPEPPAQKLEAPAPPEPAMAMWLDGKIIDLDEVDPGAILDDDYDREAQSALEADGTGMAGGILPAVDLGWIDGLSDKDLDRAEQWLEKQKKS